MRDPEQSTGNDGTWVRARAASHDPAALARTVVAMGLVACLSGIRATAFQDQHEGHGDAGTFGSVHFDTSCSPAVQPAFDRAVAMLHSFFYPETDKAFQEVAQQEPSCAMAFWGIAISQRPNPLTAPFPLQVLKQGWDAIEQARAASPATERERAWIEAMAQFYQDYETVDQRTRSLRYEAAMAAIHARYPADREAAIFHALAMLEAVDLSDKTYSRQLKAAAMLERLQKAEPDHPGVAHYLIHSYDYAPIAEKGLPAARRYAALAPSAPHALHMPSHTFSTLGMWSDALRSNLAADAAQRAYAIRVNPAAAANPAAIVARYHGLDFMTNAYLQLAQDRAAKAILDERDSLSTLPASAGLTAQTAFAAIPVRFAFERAAWYEAAGIAPLNTPFKQAEAIVWFARAIGAARSNDVTRAKADRDQLERLRDELTEARDPYWAEQVGIQAQASSAWIAWAEQNGSDAVALMRAAADREDRSEKHIAMENRLSPMRELLGELLLTLGKPKEALREFERSLETVPNRFRSLAGAADAARLSGKRRAASSYSRQLLALAAHADSERAPIAAAKRALH